ncbi:MAG: hypothetical protein QOG92_1621 [Verrucomicrobiota bacterium]|nr:hypothetical protein [Verrucomicrobiota bacterium]
MERWRDGVMERSLSVSSLGLPLARSLSRIPILQLLKLLQLLM